MIDREYAPLPSGLIVPADVARRRLSRPIGLDAFCGCGGMSLGLIQGGFEVLAGIEWEPTAAVTYMVNLCSYPFEFHFVDKDAERLMERHLSRSYRKAKKKGQLDTGILTAGTGWIATQGRAYPPVRHFIFGDISKVSGEDVCRWLNISVGELDLLAGSPPCQGFSMAGKREVGDPRNDLTMDFARLACELMPRTICMENVPSILSMVTPEGRPVVDELIEVLETGNYARADTLRKTLRAKFGDAIVLGRDRGPSRREKAPPKDDENDAEPEAEAPAQMEMFAA